MRTRGTSDARLFSSKLHSAVVLTQSTIVAKRDSSNFEKIMCFADSQGAKEACSGRQRHHEITEDIM
jgi:hypothetical protein